MAPSLSVDPVSSAAGAPIIADALGLGNHSSHHHHRYEVFAGPVSMAVGLYGAAMAFLVLGAIAYGHLKIPRAMHIVAVWLCVLATLLAYIYACDPVGTFACNTVQHQFREYHFCGSTLDALVLALLCAAAFSVDVCGCCCGRAHPRVGLVGHGAASVLLLAKLVCTAVRMPHVPPHGNHTGPWGPPPVWPPPGFGPGGNHTGPPHAPPGFELHLNVDGAALAVSVTCFVLSALRLAAQRVDANNVLTVQGSAAALLDGQVDSSSASSAARFVR